MLIMHYQVIASAQAGKNNDNRESHGETLIIDPWGTVVSRLPGEIQTTWKATFSSFRSCQ